MTKRSNKPKQNENERSRGWCLTINNWAEEHYKKVIEYKTDYTIVGKEVGTVEETPHLQIYFYIKNKVTFKTIKKDFPTAHIEKAEGSPRDNQIYCSKEKDFLEIGECPQQGRRRDLKLINESLRKTGKIVDVIDIIGNPQDLKYAESVIKYIEPKRNFKPTVKWFHGKSGSGKTRTAYEEIPHAYRKSVSTGNWWDGYDADETVIIDDIKEDDIKTYSYLLELLDRYECRVQFKGGTRQFLAKTIIITSIFTPLELFGNYNEATEILRRIDEIRKF